MSCEKWKQALVSKLYEESAPQQARDLEQHLDRCPTCRADWQRLVEARQALAAAEPAVPATPRVVVLHGRPMVPTRSWLAFAAGFACAAVLTAAGLAAGYQWGSRTTLAQAPAEITRGAVVPTGTPLDLSALEQRVHRNSGLLERLDGSLGQRYVTPEDFALQLADYQDRAERRRATEFRLLLEEIAGVEVRTGARIDDTQRALSVVLSGDTDNLAY